MKNSSKDREGKCRGCLPQIDGRLIPFISCPIHGWKKMKPSQQGFTDDICNARCNKHGDFKGDECPKCKPSQQDCNCSCHSLNNGKKGWCDTCCWNHIQPPKSSSWEDKFDEKFIMPESHLGKKYWKGGYTPQIWGKYKDMKEVKSFIKDLFALQNNKLKKIVEANHDKMSGCYDFEGIAEGVLKLIK